MRYSVYNSNREVKVNLLDTMSKTVYPFDSVSFLFLKRATVLIFHGLGPRLGLRRSGSLGQEIVVGHPDSDTKFHFVTVEGF